MFRGVESYLADRRRPPTRPSWLKGLGNQGKADLTTTTAAPTHASTPTPMAAAKAPRMRKARRHRPILRVLVALFVGIELLIYSLVTEYAPVYNFQITTVYSAAGEVRSTMSIRTMKMIAVRLLVEILMWSCGRRSLLELLVDVFMDGPFLRRRKESLGLQDPTL